MCGVCKPIWSTSTFPNHKSFEMRQLTLSDFYRGFLYIGGSCSLYSFLFFLPILLRESFGFSFVKAFTLSAPPAAFSVFYSLAFGWLADKTRQRGVWAIINSFVAVLGLALTGFLDAPSGRYVGTFLGMGGSTAMVTSALAWGQNNVRLDARRNVVTVTQVVFAAIGGIYSSQVFRQQVSNPTGIRHMPIKYIQALTTPSLKGRTGLSPWYHRNAGSPRF